MLNVTGGENLLKNLQTLQRDIPRRLQANIQELTEAWHQDVLRRITFPFQSVPSYIWESIWKLPGRKSYPDDQKGTFAEDSPSIEGTPWESQVQQYASGRHSISQKLTHETVTDGDMVAGSVGYPNGIEATSTGNKIKLILFGSVKMQPRNFLRLGLERVEGEFLRTVEQSIVKSLENPEIA